jgi:transposase-like protein
MKKNHEDKQTSASHHPVVSVNGSEKRRVILPDSVKVYLIGFHCFSEERARRWIINELYPQGLFCPRCGEGQRLSRVISLSPSMKRIVCEGCKRKFSLFTGTILSGTRLQCWQLAAMLMLMGLGHRDADIARFADTNSSTVGRWRRVLRAHGSRIV